MVVACSLYSVCCNHLGMKFIACLSCLPFPWLRDTLPGVSVALGSQPKLQNLSSAMPRGVFLFGYIPLLSSPQKCRTENARISRWRWRTGPLWVSPEHPLRARIDGSCQFLYLVLYVPRIPDATRYSEFTDVQSPPARGPRCEWRCERAAQTGKRLLLFTFP